MILMHKILLWFDPKWWKYLLEEPAEDVSIFTAFNCRRRGHPYHYIWYNPSGLEPDYHCSNCYDDLG